MHLHLPNPQKMVTPEPPLLTHNNTTGTSKKRNQIPASKIGVIPPRIKTKKKFKGKKFYSSRGRCPWRSGRGRRRWSQLGAR
jgi:hypothetical protein